MPENMTLDDFYKITITDENDKETKILLYNKEKNLQKDTNDKEKRKYGIIEGYKYIVLKKGEDFATVISELISS
jgi:hypothetical protein